jgi:hypothetical protein
MKPQNLNKESKNIERMSFIHLSQPLGRSRLC